MRIDLRWLLGLLFPSRCVGCGLRGVDICSRCLSAIRPLDPASCPRCGTPSRLGGLCPACRGYEGPLAGIRAACVYDGVARKAIHSFKYRHRRMLAGPLARLVEEELRRRPLHLDLLVPVPLHPRRLAERGYNQSALLAAHLGERLSVPVAEPLERSRETTAQAGLKAASRRANVRGAFRCAAPIDLSGRRIGIVDDVCTTGATLEECARALREAGCASAWGVVVARDL
ncbi:MAG: ComF family protein [Sphingomonadaceae bacterium]